MALYLLLTASRTWDHPAYIWDTLDELLADHGSVALFHGACPSGGDAIADSWARRRRAGGQAVVLHRFPVDAQLDGPGRAAPQRRNVRMVREFAAAVDRAGRLDIPEVHGFLREGSAGTTGCLKAARRAGFEPVVHRYEVVICGG